MKLLNDYNISSLNLDGACCTGPNLYHPVIVGTFPVSFMPNIIEWSTISQAASPLLTVLPVALKLSNTEYWFFFVLMQQEQPSVMYSTSTRLVLQKSPREETDAIRSSETISSRVHGGSRSGRLRVWRVRMFQSFTGEPPVLNQTCSDHSKPFNLPSPFKIKHSRNHV